MDLRRLEASAFSLLVPSEITFLGGLQLDLSGKTALQPLGLTLEGAAALVPPGANVIVAQVRNIHEHDVLSVVALARRDGNGITTFTDLDGVRLLGVRTGGRYGFYLYDRPLAGIAGNARDETGRRDGHLIALEGFPFVSVTDASGLFALVSPPGAFTVVATSAQFRDQIRISGTTGELLPEIVIGATPPTLRRITVRPPRLQGLYAGPLSVLGKPAPTIDDDNNGGSRGNGNGLIEAGERVGLTVAIRNDGNIAMPQGHLTLRATHAGVPVVVTPARIPFDGLAPDTPLMAGPFVVDVPVSMEPTGIIYRLTFFKEEESQTGEVVFHLPFDVEHPDVALSSEVTVEFSEPILESSLKSGLTLNQEKPGELVLVESKILLNADGTIATLRPLSPLLSDTVYRIVLSGAIVDRDGRSLAGAPLFERCRTRDLTPPMPIAPGRIEASVPGNDGFIKVTGSLGTVNPEDTVIVLNQTAGHTVLATMLPDGSFTAQIEAQAGNLITIIVRDRNGNQITIDIGTLVRRDPVTGQLISAIIGRSGGVMPGPENSALEIPPGAVPAATEFKLTLVPNGFVLPPDVAGDPVLNGKFAASFSVKASVRIEADTARFLKPLRLVLPAPAGATSTNLFLVVRSRQVTIGGPLADLNRMSGIPSTNNPVRTVTRLEILDSATVKTEGGKTFLATDSPPFDGINAPGDLSILEVTGSGQPLFLSGQVRRDAATGTPLAEAVVLALPGADEAVAFAAITDENGQFVVMAQTVAEPFLGGSLVASRLDVQDPEFARVIRRDVRATIQSSPPPNTHIASLLEPFVVPERLPQAITDILGDIEPPQLVIAVQGPDLDAGYSPVGSPLNVKAVATDNDQVQFLGLEIDTGAGLKAAALSVLGEYEFIPTNSALVRFRAQAIDRSQNATFTDRFVRVFVPGGAPDEQSLPDVEPQVVDEPGEPATPDQATPGEQPKVTDVKRNFSFDQPTSVGFSERLDPSTVTEETVQLLDPEGERHPITVLLSASRTRINIKPRRYLRFGATYWLVLSNGIKGTNGLSLSALSAKPRPLTVPGLKQIAAIPLAVTTDVAALGNYLVATTYSPGGNGEGTLHLYQVIDESEPSKLVTPPLLKSSTRTGRFPWSITVDGCLLFVADRFTFSGVPSTLHVYDLSNPADPKWLNPGAVITPHWGFSESQAPQFAAYDLYSLGTEIAMTAIANSSLPPKDYVHPWPNRVERTPQGIAVYAMGDFIQFFLPSHPLSVLGFVGHVEMIRGGSWVEKTPFRDVAFFDGFAVASEREGLQVVSTTDLGNGGEESGTVNYLGFYPMAGLFGMGALPAFTWADESGVAHTSDLALALHASLGLFIFDVTAGVPPQLLSSVPGARGVISCDAARGLAYLHNADGGFFVIDLNNPRQPVDLNNPGLGKEPFRVIGVGGSQNAAVTHRDLLYLGGESGIGVVKLPTGRSVDRGMGTILSVDAKANGQDSVVTTTKVPVQFTLTVDQRNCPELRFFWQFGDGETSTERNPLHTFMVSSISDTILTVRSSECGGATAQDTVKMIVVLVDIVQTNGLALVGSTTNVAYSLTSDSATNVTWTIEPTLGATGALFAISDTGTGVATTWRGTNVWVNPGNIVTNYTITAYAEEFPDFHDTATFAALNIELEPVTIRPGNGGTFPLYNPCAIAIGQTAQFEIKVDPSNVIPDRAIVWTSTSSSVSFQGGNIGRLVTVKADSTGVAQLKVDIQEFAGTAPTIQTEGLELKTVKVNVWIVCKDDGTDPATTESHVANLIAQANGIFKQAAITLVLEGSIHYTNRSAWLVVEQVGDDWPENNSICAITGGTGGIEMYFVDSIDGATGLNSASGLLLSDNANFRTTAHEIGHTCGLNDVYLSGGGLSVIGAVASAWAPDDWNGGPSPQYYEGTLSQGDLLQRLLMYGTFSTTKSDLPRGKIYGVWYEWQLIGGSLTKVWHLNLDAVGLSDMGTRQPTHN